MEDIYIIGAGGLAKEVHFLIREIGGYQIKAFVDLAWNPPITISGNPIPVINEDKLIELRSMNINLALAVGTPKTLLKLSSKFGNDFRYPNLIHPSVIMDKDNLNIGVGNIIFSAANFTTDIRLGSFNIMNPGCTIAHDCYIGNCNVFSPGCNISGGVQIDDTTLIGTNAAILQYLKVGSNAIVGAGSLVTKNVENDKIVVGVPARYYEKGY